MLWGRISGRAGGRTDGLHTTLLLEVQISVSFAFDFLLSLLSFRSFVGSAALDWIGETSDSAELVAIVRPDVVLYARGVGAAVIY